MAFEHAIFTRRYVGAANLDVPLPPFYLFFFFSLLIGRKLMNKALPEQMLLAEKGRIGVFLAFLKNFLNTSRR